MTEWIKPALEVLILFLIVYPALRFMKEWRGAGMLKGLGLVFVSALVVGIILVELFQLAVVRLFFEQFVLISVLALVVIFQPELRMGLVRLGETTAIGKLLKPEREVVDGLLTALRRMSRDRVGALVALERDVPLESFVEGGVRLDAKMSSELLESIFYPGSSLHDGAAVVRQGRVVAASCLFPLTDNPDISKRLGTRHRAAIGVTEESDAITVIVSEETGMISVGMAGKLYQGMSPEDLLEFLGTNYLGVTETPTKERAVVA